MLPARLWTNKKVFVSLPEWVFWNASRQLERKPYPGNREGRPGGRLIAIHEILTHLLPTMSSPDIKPATEPLAVPVAFIAFNRPDYTRRVLELIRRARPQTLFLITDGPRTDRPGEAARCQEVRKILEDLIDWPCTVHRNHAN